MKLLKCLTVAAIVGLGAAWTSAAESGQAATGEGTIIVTVPELPPADAAAPLPPGAPSLGPIRITAPLPPGTPVPPPGGEGGVRFIAIPAMPPGPAKKVKVAYLGVAASKAGDLIADQLKLGKGTGLVVDFVEEGSPAAKAGLRPHDVLVRLGDQILVNPPQLAVLVRLQKPGDKVTLAVIREAKEQKVTAELIEKEQVIGPDEPGQAWFRSLPVPNATLNLIPMHEWGNPEAMKKIERGRAEAEATRARALAEHARRMGNLAAPGSASASASVSMSDGEHTLTLTITDGKKHFVAKDKDGRVLFDGPITTDEERAKVPPEILKKLQNMEATTQINIKVEAGPAPAHKPPAVEPGKPETPGTPL